MRVLVVEDDSGVAAYILRVKVLAEAGHVGDHAADGRTGLVMAASADYDALVVDRMLPGPDGLTIVRTLRASDDRTPVLFSARWGRWTDRVRGLRAGG